MKFPFSILKECINFNKNYTANEVADYITSIGLEVEDIFFPALKYKNFIIAEVLSTEKHPESNKLTLCKVNTGTEVLDVVCGAENVREGIKVVFVKIGGIVPQNGMEIKKASVRGKESNGMICSAAELGLEGKFPKEHQIIELPLEAKVGTDFADYINFNDEVLHIAITPNRGDSCSIIGIARDLIAKGLGTKKEIFTGNHIKASDLEIKIEKDVIEVLENTNFAKFSSGNFSIKKDLEKYNNVWGTSGVDIVDMANLLMYITGAPMHIYDASKIKGSITIRRSLKDEKLIPIKGEEILLPADLLVVADSEKILSLLGVMGDARSKTENSTTEFLLEVLYAEPNEIIKSSRSTGIKSDSSYRFERGVDFKIQNKVLNLFLNKLDIKSTQSFSLQTGKKESEIKFAFSDYKKITGTEVSKERIKEILTLLEFEIISETKESLLLKVPSFKYDFSIKEDIVEEIARIQGYETIFPQAIEGFNSVKNTDTNFEIKKILSEELNEIISYSFFKEKYFGLFGREKEKLNLTNPITEDLAVMRDSLIPNLLENISNSEKRGIKTSKLFEVGTIFEGTSEEAQKTNICAVFSGLYKEKSFLQKEEKFSIWHAKNKMLEVLLRGFGLAESSFKFTPLQNQHLHTYQSFSVSLGKNVIAILGAIHPITLDSFDIKERVFFFEIYTENLPQKKQKPKSYTADLLPEVNREIAIIVSKDILFESIMAEIKSLKIQNITEVSVKDIFEDTKRIGEGLKSILIEFKIKQEKETLTKEEIDDKIIGSIISKLSSKLGAKIRDGETAK